MAEKYFFDDRNAKKAAVKKPAVKKPTVKKADPMKASAASHQKGLAKIAGTTAAIKAGKNLPEAGRNERIGGRSPDTTRTAGGKYGRLCLQNKHFAGFDFECGDRVGVTPRLHDQASLDDDRRRCVPPLRLHPVEVANQMLGPYDIPGLEIETVQISKGTERHDIGICDQ